MHLIKLNIANINIDMARIIKENWFVVCIVIVTLGYAIPIRPQKTLVLVDNVAFYETHSLLFDILKCKPLL